MVTDEDHRKLTQATELLMEVIERHHGEDLRMLSILTSAIQSIRTGERYLGAANERVAT